ncbi:Crp/Fnr family transcriptional regulator [Streptococcus pacificus]|uniref:Crp/Fnr family transcriptional regulator n=1 Tax=Streptococcus pacificus TaxID=2740577 RepID=A0ABS0ZIE7_9STRE|nr:Crp/Fnr family transcriptional regulator [Streptococcus pacificus]MBJ8325746.1 Crp/Fnr family transcriptional regulator [Streptococcus pacificus]
MVGKELYQHLRELDDFKYLEISKFDQLVASMTYHKVPKDQILFFDGDPLEKIYILLKGHVKLEQSDSSGSFIYIDYVNTDTIFPYGGLFLDKSYRFSAVAITAVEYICFPRDIYESFSLSNKNQMKMLCQKLSKLIHLQEFRIRNIVTSSAKDRVIQTLAFLLVDKCSEEMDLPFSITTIDIANMSGTTRETVSHVLKPLKENKIIHFEHKKLSYLDKDYFLKYIK